MRPSRTVPTSATTSATTSGTRPATMVATTSATTSASSRLVLRSAALGLATGARTTLGVAAPLVHWRAGRPGAGRSRLRTAAAVGSVLLVALELVGDKLPQAPSRLDPPGPLARVASGALGSALLRRGGSPALAPPLLAAFAGSLAGAYGGAAWRGWASRRVPDWQAAVVEDVVALMLAGTAARGDG